MPNYDYTINPVDVSNYQKGYANSLAIQSAQAEVAAKQQAAARDAKLRELVPLAMAGDQNALAQATALDSKIGLGLRKDFRDEAKNQREAHAAELKAGHDRAETIAAGLNYVTKQPPEQQAQAYTKFLDYAQNVIGLDVSKMPREYDPQQAAIGVAQMDKLKDQLARELDKFKFEHVSGNTQYQGGITTRGQDINQELGQQRNALTAQSQQIQMRGQNMTDARAQERNRLEYGDGGTMPAGDRVLTPEEVELRHLPPGDYLLGKKGTIKPLKPTALTESQGAATAYGLRAVDMDKTLVQMEEGGFDPNTKGFAKDMVTSGNVMTNWMASSKGQKYVNAGKNFIAAILRKESGASISASEWDSGRELYIPMPGDGKDKLEQKRQNRKLAIEGMRVQAGQGASKIPETYAGAPKTETGFIETGPNGNPIVTPTARDNVPVSPSGWSIQRID